jgi:hypothetical protein
MERQVSCPHPGATGGSGAEPPLWNRRALTNGGRCAAPGALGSQFFRFRVNRPLRPPPWRANWDETSPQRHADLRGSVRNGGPARRSDLRCQTANATLPAESCARGRRLLFFPFPKGERSAEKRTSRSAKARPSTPGEAWRAPCEGALASRRSTVAISVLGPALPVPAFEQRRPFSDINLAAKW